MDERAWLGLRSCLQGAQKETLSPDAGKASARPQPQWQGGEAESLRSGWTSCSPSAPERRLDLLQPWCPPPRGTGTTLPPGTPQGTVTVYLEMGQCPSLEGRPESAGGIVRKGQTQMEQRCTAPLPKESLPCGTIFQQRG